MKYSFLFIILLMFSCDTSDKKENTNTTEEVSVETTSIEKSQESSSADSEGLFEHFRQFCFKGNNFYRENDAFELGGRILAAYNSTSGKKPYSADFWQVMGVPFCSEDLVLIHLRSFNNQNVEDYQVSINENDEVSAFVKSGFGLGKVSQMTMLDSNTMRTTIINGQFEIFNVFEDRVHEEDFFGAKEYGPEIGNPVGNKELTFNINIMGQQRTVDLYTLPKANMIKSHFDLYINDKFYFRLPAHSVNSWAFQGVDSVRVVDINGDSKDDFILSCSAITGMGPEGNIPFSRSSAYIQEENFRFGQDHNLDSRLDIKMSIDSLRILYEQVYL